MKEEGRKDDKGKHPALYNYYEGISILVSSAAAPASLPGADARNVVRYAELGGICLHIATNEDIEDKILMLSDLFFDIAQCPLFNVSELTVPELLRDISWVCKHGADKYALLNYRNLDPLRCLSALMRHAGTILLDDDFTDSESGLPHISHILANILILAEIYQLKSDGECV